MIEIPVSTMIMMIRLRIVFRSEEHTSELQSQSNLVCRLLLEKTNTCALDYPKLEIIVVDDGASEATAAIAARHLVRVATTDNAGLATPRDEGIRFQPGALVARATGHQRARPRQNPRCVARVRRRRGARRCSLPSSIDGHRSRTLPRSNLRMSPGAALLPFFFF